MGTAEEQLTKGVVTVYANRDAFAALKSDGSLIAWGHPDLGGDCSSVQEQLKGVQSIVATNTAFAARKCDGSVVTWGHPEAGGDSSAVQANFFSGVQCIYA